MVIIGARSEQTVAITSSTDITGTTGTMGTMGMRGRDAWWWGRLPGSALSTASQVQHDPCGVGPTAGAW